MDLSSLPFISAHFRPPLLPPNSPIALLFAMKVLDASLLVFLCSSHDDAHALSCSQWRVTALITFRKEQRHHERNIFFFSSIMIRKALKPSEHSRAVLT